MKDFKLNYIQKPSSAQSIENVLFIEAIRQEIFMNTQVFPENFMFNGDKNSSFV